MRVCSNMNSLAFLDAHYMWSLGITNNLEAGGCYKKLEGDGVGYAIGYPLFFNREGWLDVIENKTWWTADRRMIAIGRLSTLSMHEENQRLHGLSGVGIDSSDSG